MILVNKIITFLQELVKAYPITTTIIIGVFTNLLTDAFKKMYRLTMSNSSILIRKMSIAQLENTIQDLKIQKKEILKFQKDPVKQYSFYLSQIQTNFIMLIFMLLFVFFFKEIVGKKYELGFYGALGFTISRAIRIFLETIYNINFVEKVAKSEYYLDKIEEKIVSILEKIETKKSKLLDMGKAEN